MTETKTPSSADSGADIGVDIPSSTRAKTTQVENEIFVEQLLGIRIPDAPNSLRLAEQITNRIAQNVDQTRTRIERARMQAELNQRISDGLRRVRAPRTNESVAQTDPVHLQRVRVVAEAVRETVSKEILDEFLRYGMPIALDVKAGVPRHHLRLPAIGIDGPSSGGVFPLRRPRDILIDTRHAFWAEQGPFADQAALATALKGLKLISAGMQIIPSDLGPSYELTQDDANRIAGYAGLNVISVARRYFPLEDTVTVDGNPVAVRMNIDALVATEIPGPERYLGNFTRPQIYAYLSNQANWNQWVPALRGRNPLTTNVTYAGATNPAIDYLLNRIVAITGFGGGGTLARQNMQLHEIQRETREQHQYHRKLREGSDNHYSAAVAAAILMKYKDKAIHEAMGAGSDRVDIENKYNSANFDYRLQEMLEKLEAATSSFAPTVNFQHLNNKLTAIATAWGTPGIWAPGGTINITVAGSPPEIYAIPPAGTPSDQARAVQQAREWLRNRQTEYENQIKQYRDIQALIRPIVQELHRRATLVPPVSMAGIDVYDYYNRVTWTPDPIHYTTGVNLKQLSDQVRTNLRLKPKDKVKEDAEKHRKQLDDLDAGKTVGVSGDKAQHDVIAKYMELYHNCSPEEAKDATNYIRARGLLDTDMREAAEDIVADLYGDRRREDFMERTSQTWGNRLENLKNLSLQPEERSRRIISNVARACNITGIGRNPDWRRASYENVCTAYFGMKKLANGEGPAGIRLQRTEVFQQQMREITRVMLQRHTAALTRDFSVALNLSDEKQKELLKEPNKQEHIRLFRQMLEGEAPEKYKAKIDASLEKASRKTEWFRRSVLLGKEYGLVRGDKLKISAKNLLYGNKIASLWGLTGSKEYGFIRGDKNKVSGKNLLYGNEMASLWGLTGGAQYGFVRGEKNKLSAKNLLYGNEYASVKGVTYNIPKKAVTAAWNNKGSLAFAGLLTAFAGPVGAVVGAAYLANKASQGGGAAPAPAH